MQKIRVATIRVCTIAEYASPLQKKKALTHEANRKKTAYHLTTERTEGKCK